MALLPAATNLLPFLDLFNRKGHAASEVAEITGLTLSEVEATPNWSCRH